MRNIYIWLSIIFLPILTYAQKEQPLLENVADKVSMLFPPVKIDNNTSVIRILNKDETCDILAISEQLKELWRSSFADKDVVIGMGLFNNKIIVITQTKSKTKGVYEEYKAYALNVKNGNIINERKIYEAVSKYEEQAYPHFAIDGSFLKITFRTSEYKRGFGFKNPDNIYHTTAIATYSFNDDFQIIKTFVPVFGEGKITDIVTNKNGDLFIGVLAPDAKKLSITRYPINDDASSGSIEVDVNFLRSAVFWSSPKITLMPSSLHNDIAYYSTLIKNESGEREFIVSKLNFATKKVLSFNKLITKEYLRGLKDNLKEQDKKSVDFGDKINFGVNYLSDESGYLISSINGRFFNPVDKYRGFCVNNSCIISSYDDAMKELNQQVIPLASFDQFRYLDPGYHIKDNVLQIIMPHGFNGYQTFSYELDIPGLAVKKTANLAKYQINGSISGQQILWFNSGFLLPYLTPNKNIFTNMTYVLSLQLNGR